MNIPDELTHDDHVVIGGPQGSHRFDIEIEDYPRGPGVFVKGLTPPDYSPIVWEAGPRGVYHVRQCASPEFTVDLAERKCECRDRKDGHWCIHLRAVAAYQQQDGEHGADDLDDRGGLDDGSDENGIPEAEITAEIDRMMENSDREFENEEQEAEHRETLRRYITGGSASDTEDDE